MQNERDKYTTGGGFGSGIPRQPVTGGAFANKPSNVQKPSVAGPGITLRGAGPTGGQRATAGMRTDYRTQAMEASQAAGEKYRQGQSDIALVRQQMPGFAQANPEGLQLHASGLAAAIRAQQVTGKPAPVGGALQATPAATQPVSAEQMIAEQNKGFNEMPIAPGVYQSETGNRFGDSMAATQEGAFTRTGMMDLPREGGVAYAQGFGPFGRTPEEQTKIENRVNEIQRATDFIRGMRDLPTEQEKLQRQAGQYVSLNQGLGAFLNQASQRNYARDRLKDIEENTAKSDKLAADQLQQGFENQVELQKLRQGAFATDTIELPNGTQVPMITNNQTGEVTYGQAPQVIPTAAEAQTQAEAEAKKMESDAPFLSGEQDTFNGSTREAWIKARVAELTGQGGQQQAPQQQAATRYKNPKTGETVEWNGKEWVKI